MSRHLKCNRRPWRFRTEAAVGQGVNLLQFAINGLGQGEGIEELAQAPLQADVVVPFLPFSK